jgi:probable HAF family extracellular repeat protein
MQDLGVVDDDIFSIALGINDMGQIVGTSLETDFMTIRAFIRHNGKLVDLNKRVAGRTNLFLQTACSINFKGQITGLAYDSNTNYIHAYLATPAQ